MGEEIGKGYGGEGCALGAAVPRRLGPQGRAESARKLVSLAHHTEWAVGPCFGPRLGT